MTKISPLWRSMRRYVIAIVLATMLFSSGAYVWYIDSILARSAQSMFEDISKSLALRLSQYLGETEQICSVLARNNTLIDAMLKTSDDYQISEQYDDYFKLSAIVSYNQSYRQISGLKLAFTHDAFYTNEKSRLITTRDAGFSDALPQAPVWLADENSIRRVYPVRDFKYSPEPVGLIILTLNESNLTELFGEVETFEGAGFELLLDGALVRAYGRGGDGVSAYNEILPQWSFRLTASSLAYTVSLKDAVFAIAPWLIGGILVTVFMFSCYAKIFYREISTLARDISSADIRERTLVENRKYPELSAIVTQFNALMEQLRLFLRSETNRQEKERVLSIQMLESQINPHFLYNSLDVINWLAYQQGADAVAELSQKLGAFYRDSLRGTDRQNLLEVELAHVCTYLDIMRYRIDGCIELEITGETTGILLPRLSLQPLVENAVQHGLLAKPNQSGRISICVSDIGEQIAIDVTDDGPGMSEAQIAEFHKGLNLWPPKQMHGLTNVHHRAQLLYGDAFGLTLASRTGHYMRVRLTVPKASADAPLR